MRYLPPPTHNRFWHNSSARRSPRPVNAAVQFQEDYISPSRACDERLHLPPICRFHPSHICLSFILSTISKTPSSRHIFICIACMFISSISRLSAMC
uniref:Uncharacterized protein n=1 Tax=Steinernema glaseri TaxID=37863 RepID=A0A1I7ZQP8_9BILA